MLPRWPIYAKEMFGSAYSTSELTFRSGECRCQSFVCQVQEDLGSRSISEGLHRPNTWQPCAGRRIPYPTNPIFALQMEPLLAKRLDSWLITS
jgi:hypothetical protein